MTQSPPAGVEACRTLHWVTKIGNLKASLRFFETVFGFRVLRHEEFESGCEATCNGPYGGAWSKTMVGWGPEKENFVFELTYNYGIDGYARGDDVQCFEVRCPEAVERARCFGYAVAYDLGVPVIEGPDGFRYKILPAAAKAERFEAVVLKSSDLARTEAYWCGVLGMSKFHADAERLVLGWKEDQTKLAFVLKAGPVEHGLASGRIANACPAVEPFYDAAKTSGGSIMNPPLTLPTPGKADVVVTILADPDSYEICFVGDVGFYDLATPTYDVVDWALRAKRGGDGGAPPKPPVVEKKSLANVPEIATQEELDALADGKKLVVVDFGASWCKKCIGLRDFFENLAATTTQEDVVFASADVDDVDVSITSKFSVSKVPHFVFLDARKNPLQELQSAYIGSSKPDIEAKLKDAIAAIA